MKTPELKLISHKLCPYVQRARIVLQEKSIPHQVEFIDLSNKPRWFTELSPLGKVPLLLVDGRAIFESAVIAEYLDEITPAALHPSDPLQRARNRAWIEFASKTLDAIASLYNAATVVDFENCLDTLKGRFRTLEHALDGNPWFNGARFSLADAAFGPVFRYFDVIDRHADLGLFAETPRLRAWRAQLRRRPSIRGAVVEDYPERLEQFIRQRRSILSTFIEVRVGAARTVETAAVRTFEKPAFPLERFETMAGNLERAEDMK